MYIVIKTLFSLKTKHIRIFIFLFILCCFSSISAKLSNASLNHISELSNAHGASGFEDSIRKILKKNWIDLVDSIEIDGSGNLYGIIKGKGQKNKPMILLMAHMDEVGLFIREITDEGFLKIGTLGGWYPNVILAQKWKIQTSKGLITAISGIEAPHAMKGFPNVDKKIEIDHLFLDIGVSSKKEVFELGIRPGLPVTPDSCFSEINQTGRYIGKAFDDRLALALITDLLKYFKNKKLPFDLAVVATVQEEVGMRGAGVVTKKLNPDIVINLESAIVRDFPTIFMQNNNKPKLGQGICFFVYDSTMIPNPKLIDYLCQKAYKGSFLFQFESEMHYGQDGSSIQMTTAKGPQIVNLGIPVRYIHSHIGIFDERDYESSYEYLKYLIENFSNEDIWNITNHE